jgi:WD40 repeat protein
MAYKPVFGRGAEREVREREFKITRSAGLFASRQFPESAVPSNALYDCQDIVPGTFRLRRGSGSTSLDNAFWKPSITGTPKISGLFSFRRHDGTSSLIASIGGGVYKAPGDVFTKLSDPSDLPTNNVNSVSFSLDGTYMAVASFASPYILIYKRNGNTFTKLSNPADLPPASAQGVAFSPDGVYLSVAHGTTPYITIYKRSGDTFAKLTDPDSLPTGNGYRTAFSPDGTYLSVTQEFSPYINIYKRSGDTFAKLANPADLPTGDARGVSFTSDGTYLAVAHFVSPYVTIYKRSGDTFTKLSDPATLPTGAGGGASFSTDGVYLSISHAVTPFVTIYKRTGDTFTKLIDPGTLPTGTGIGTAFSSDGAYLSVAHLVSPFITTYKRTGDTFTKLSDPATPPTASANSVSFSSDGSYLGVGGTFTKYIFIYKRSAGITATALETGLTDNNFEFATMNDVMYYVNGDNGLRQYDGTTAAAVTAETVASSEPANYLSDAANEIHNSRYITVHENVVYLSSPLAQPYRLYRSDELHGPTYFHNYVDVISERGGEIRWMTSFAGALIILKSDSIWAADGLIGDSTFRLRRLHNKIGCAEGRTVQEVPGLGLVFMGSDRHFYVLRPDYVNGENVPLFRLSSHISDLVDTILTSDPAEASGVDKNLYVCSVNLLGGGIQKRILVFDFTRVESIPNDPTSLFVPWSIYYEDADKVYVRHIDNSTEYLMGASETGIFYFEYPSDIDLYDSAFFELYNLDFEQRNVRKYHSTLNTVLNSEGRNNTVQPSISVDDGSYTDLGTIDTYTADATRLPQRFGLASSAYKTTTHRLNVNQTGYRFRYKFTIQAGDYKREFLEFCFRYTPEEVR